ncbi:sialidase family protein [Acidithrix sp. C25]|uniref:WD40/YVTN/BNR-like repeat-containing protein n=1 Tax=Acidithrix sp. C25 TaxID=1671482 RepID=UPI00191BB5DD|nr:sialidase family protein [Acidithrix sp. C25]
MTEVRLLIGTKKGAFIIDSANGRSQWQIQGPLFGGWEIYHINASPLNKNLIYASQFNGWFGQVLQRSFDAGKTWEAVSNSFNYSGEPKPHLWYDGSSHLWEFAKVWNLSPSLFDEKTVFAGIEDAAIFVSHDAGESWGELHGLREHSTAGSWQPGAGGLCLHTVIQDPTNSNRIYVGISAAGAFKSDDAGLNWKPINKGLRADYLPDDDVEVGHCVHRLALHRSKPEVLFMQKHWDVMRSDDAGENWYEISGNLPSDFGFAIAVDYNNPETVYVIPIKSDSEHFPPDHQLRVYRSQSGGYDWQPMSKGLPQSHFYGNVLRGALSSDQCDPCGIYFGTTTGEIYASRDSGDSFMELASHLPSVLSVEAHTLE